jgi:hypothetical protein
MPFYAPSDREFRRLYLTEVAMAFSAMDCVLCREPAIYASTELTTGVRLYDALRKAGVKTAAELREKMGRDWYTTHVWDANVAAAMAFADDVRRAHDCRTQVITPAPFTAPEWTQSEYLAFWETLLRDHRRVNGVWFNRNWQFSNGCTFEFAVACDARLSTCDHEGQTLDQDAAIDLIREAIDVLRRDGFDTQSLRDNLERVVGARRSQRTTV